MEHISTAPPSPHTSNAGWKAAFWVLGLAVAGHFLWVTAQRYAQVTPEAYGMFWDRRRWLWLHVAGGSLAMLAGASQFVAALRRRWPGVHRWLGRTYLLGILLGSTAVVGLLVTTQGWLALKLAFAATGLAWLITSLRGYRTIRRGEVDAHRRWMLRSYLVTLSPAVFRLFLLIPALMQLASPLVMVPSLLVLSWALPLLAYESGRRLPRLRTATARARMA
ncbi:DUF2306 domain-containing protein [Stenotrophomonas sp. CC120223-11]|uniref:DUF2306 domain-containing protein n=1 Tax=Stenotrophomonas sp. CC120223-11 TaxID=1378090 RepID=UPI000BD95A91|nr:DUF2306 domain-containing protein [Stenotrophomonas sp. CC120223-11]SNY72221.1 Uncharacterized membrane protein [Stenotrophomonas sp. CC120223-11]